MFYRTWNDTSDYPDAFVVEYEPPLQPGFDLSEKDKSSPPDNAAPKELSWLKEKGQESRPREALQFAADDSHAAHVSKLEEPPASRESSEEVIQRAKKLCFLEEYSEAFNLLQGASRRGEGELQKWAYEDDSPHQTRETGSSTEAVHVLATWRVELAEGGWELQLEFVIPCSEAGHETAWH